MNPHFRTPARLAGALAVLIGISGLTTDGAGAASSEIDEQHAASRLAVTDFAGTLRIEAHYAKGIQLVLRGSAETLAAITREVRDDTLHVEGGAAGTTVTSSGGVIVRDGTNTTVSIGNNTVITQSGVIGGTVFGSLSRTGRSRVVINGEVIEPGSLEPTELVIRVPKGTPIDITRMIGDVAVEDVDGWVGLELSSGRAEVDRMEGGNLALAGSGRIEVGMATGNLAVSVHGAGDLTIDRAELSDLDVSMAGAGKVAVAGVAEQARIWVAGASKVSIDEVRNRPTVQTAGASRVTIGNW